MEKVFLAIEHEKDLSIRAKDIEVFAFATIEARHKWAHEWALSKNTEIWKPTGEPFEFQSKRYNDIYISLEFQDLDILK